MTYDSDVRSRIESANKEFMAAFKRGDAAAIATLYTGQGQLLPEPGSGLSIDYLVNMPASFSSVCLSRCI